MNYDDIIARKSASVPAVGFDADDIGEHLFPHQVDLVRWALKRGRAAIFADTGLGKGLMLLEWARQVSFRGRVLVLAPLAVGPQLAAEAKRFGVRAVYLREDDPREHIVITNYEMLHKFDTSKFVGVVLDESSILKSYDGKTKQRLLDAFARTPYRLACTATPAPNDFTELGNHSEFLGLKSRVEMLAEYFVHDGGSTQDWRIKGHALVPFWKWVSTWGAVVKMPSDLGYDDGAFSLPALEMREHVVHSEHDPRVTGTLFAMDARTLSEQRAVRRGTIGARVEKAARLAREYACGDLTPNTCASITSATKTSSGAAESNRTKQTRANAKSTPRSRKSATTTNEMPASGAEQIQIESETSTSARSMGSRSLTTTGCSPSSADAALSVSATRTPTGAGSTLTTTTTPERSGDCSADHATSGSGSSAMTSTTSNAPSRIWKTSVVVWCELNDEQDALTEELGDLCVSIQGSDSDDDKIDRHDRWLRGDVPILLAKAQCFGFGLNWQHCHRMIFIGASHSYERTYQAIRRCWRFGQESEVTIDLVRSDLESAIVENYRRKENDAAKMAAEMTAHVGAAVRAEVRGLSREFNAYNPATAMRLPSWIGAAA